MTRALVVGAYRDSVPPRSSRAPHAHDRRIARLPHSISDYFARIATKSPHMNASAINSATNSSGGNTIKSTKFDLKAEDFIKMMITQLQNQDPMEPAKNEQLLAQMSQIGQLQSATQLQTSMSGMMLQNQIGSAGNLIGKTIEGLDDNNESVKGVVNSVRVEKDKVFLELDTGKRLALDRVTTIAPTSVAKAAA